jgi:predicted mannosyl-3-phosphoglycerate phosphatase (HAD superfamily)
MQHVEIRVKGQINQQWSEWFGGLTICHSGRDETVLTGPMPDQAALYGVISHLRDLGLQLISVSSKEIKEDSHEYNQ